MTDQEIVDGLINRDEKITDWFFNIKYRPLFINVIKLIFDYQVDYDECISELYYHLMKNDAAVLRNFEGRSTIGTWIKIVAIRFFCSRKKREQMIEDESKEPLYEQNHEEEIDDSESKIAAKIDLERLFDLMSNKRYVMVIRELVLKEVECLVPYEELPEEEKVYDRNSSVETLKLIMKLGFKISKDEE